MKKAFTLIELLIVIAILAILAIGVLAAIDPIEQFNRGNDSTELNTAAEYKNAVDRYYAGKGVFPAALTANAQSFLNTGIGSSSITDMQAAGELKGSFTSGGGGRLLTGIEVTVTAAGASPVVCVSMVSKTFRGNTSALYNMSGGAPTAGSCPNATNAACNICYF